MLTIRQKLLHALTEHDRKESKKKGHNIHFLGVAIGRLDEIMPRIEQGENIRQVLLTSFNDRLLSRLLNAVGEEDFTLEEKQSQSLTYR